MRTLRPNAKLQYGSSPTNAFQIDAKAEPSLIQEMNPSVSITAPTIPQQSTGQPNDKPANLAVHLANFKHHSQPFQFLMTNGGGGGSRTRVRNGIGQTSTHVVRL